MFLMIQIKNWLMDGKEVIRLLILGVAYMLVIGAVIVSMTVLLLKGKKEKYNIIYLICQMLVGFWCGSQILILLSESSKELAVSYLLGNVGICFIGAFWYYFAVSYAGKRLYSIEKYLPFGLSVFHFLLVLTNGKHHLYYTFFSKDLVEHGIFFYTNVAETYILVIVGAVILYRNLAAKKEGETEKRLIIASVLVPMLMNLIYLAGFVRASFDITPLGFGISGIFVLLATIKYRFMEVNITAFDVILSGLSDGVGIFGKNGKCTYVNQAFYTLLGFCQTEKQNDFTINVVEEKLMGLKSQEQGEAVFMDEKGSYLQIQIYQTKKFTPADSKIATDKSEMIQVKSGSKKDGMKKILKPLIKDEMLEISDGQIEKNQTTVFVVKDISKYYELLHQTRELAIINERLALERERNRIAQQVHDTAGHTLTMIQSYMKLAEVSNEKQEAARVREYLAEARTLSSEGIRELRQSINQLRKEASYELVTQGIMQLADQVKEIPVEVTVQGEDSRTYSHLSRVLYDCTRESITNTLKYANASKMEIIIRFQQDTIVLMIGDDGKGCEELKENNGICGIRERVEEIGGTVKFISSKGEGFLTRIKIPV